MRTKGLLYASRIVYASAIIENLLHGDRPVETQMRVMEEFLTLS